MSRKLDNNAWKKDTYNHHRFYFHKRSILILEQLIKVGKVDSSKCISKNVQSRSFTIKSFELTYNDYIQLLQEEGMKPSTIYSYAKVTSLFASCILFMLVFQ